MGLYLTLPPNTYHYYLCYKPVTIPGRLISLTSNTIDIGLLKGANFNDYFILSLEALVISVLENLVLLC